GVDTLVVGPVPSLLDGLGEGVVYAVETILDDVREAQHEWQVVALLAQVIDHVDDGNAALAAMGDRQFPAVRDREVTGRPRADAIELVGVGDSEAWVEVRSAHGVEAYNEARPKPVAGWLLPMRPRQADALPRRLLLDWPPMPSPGYDDERAL